MKGIYYLIGLGGLSGIVLVHEMGHFIAARFFGIPVDFFSIGFGSAIFKFSFMGTLFQFAWIPFGGYVVISPDAMNAQSFIVQIFVLMAGILVNLICAGFLIWVVSHQKCNRRNVYALFQELVPEMDSVATRTGFVGPLGIIKMVGMSALCGMRHFLLMLAYLNINVALFNLLPLPFFDGGQIFYKIVNILGAYGEENALVYLLLLIFILTFILLYLSKSVDKKRL